MTNVKADADRDIEAGRAARSKANETLKLDNE